VTLYLVTGPPASGKSTWVKQHAQLGDITIDYDALANVLTPSDGKPHEHPAHIRAVTKAARQAAMDTALRYRDTVNVYVIHSTPSAKMLALYDRLGAQVITIDPGRDVVLERCRRERPWQMEQVAKRWYEDRQHASPVVADHPGVADTTRDW